MTTEGYEPLSQVTPLNSSRRSRRVSQAPTANDFEERVERVLSKQTTLGRLTSRESIESASEAMKHLLGFVHIDPDGGLLNLESRQDLEDDQFTKLHVMFKKETLRQMVGVVMVCRMILNVPHVFLASTHVMICEVTGRCDIFARSDLLSSCALPLRQMAVAVSGFEFAWMLGLVCSVIYDLCAFKCSTANSVEGRAKKRFYHLANMFFFSFGYLQNFSAMACLRYVHPAYIGHYVKMLNDTEAAVIHLGRRMFKLKEDEATDEDIHDSLLQVVYRDELSSHRVSTTSSREKIMECYSYKTSYDLFKEMMAKKDLNDELIRDAAALTHSWKVRLVAFCETLMFILFSMFVAFFGCMAFIVKLCRVAFVLLDVESPWYMTLWVVVAFLNQALGIMAIQQMLRDRILWFLFGGQDARVSLEERSLMLAYQAVLAEKVWTVHIEDASIAKRCLALLTFSGDDIQRLVLEEHIGEKSAITYAVRTQMVDKDVEADCMRYRLAACIKKTIRGDDASDEELRVASRSLSVQGRDEGDEA